MLSADAPEAPDLAQQVAGAADLCRQPLLHAVRPVSPGPLPAADGCSALDCSLTLEVRDAAGERQPQHDLELELFHSGSALNLTLAWLAEPERPMLWHGQHPVWMDASGRRCERPQDGMRLEALARRLRALLI